MADITDNNRGICVGIVIFIVVTIIIYIIVMYELYRNNSFIFTIYPKPTPPASANAFYPLGTVTPLTADEIAMRNKIINESAMIAP